jgi:hypothetical protein
MHPIHARDITKAYASNTWKEIFRRPMHPIQARNIPKAYESSTCRDIPKAYASNTCKRYYEGICIQYMQEIFRRPMHLSMAVQIEYLLIVIPLPAGFSDINDPPGEFHPPLLTHISRHLPLAMVGCPTLCIILLCTNK